jgi:hypothetical protein
MRKEFCSKYLWGNNIWLLIHLTTYEIELTNTNIRRFKTFIESLANYLPCHICRKNFHIKTQSYLKKNNEWKEELFLSRSKLIFIFFKIHQNVNKSINKDLNPLEEYYEEYKKIEDKKKYINHIIEKLHACHNIDENFFYLFKKIKLK